MADVRITEINGGIPVTTTTPIDTYLETDNAARGSEQISIYHAMGGIEFRPDLTGLTGGSATDLDSLVTATGRDVDALVLLVVSGAMSIYQLTAGTDAESSPSIIRPDDYATTTNEKVWKLVLS